MDRLIKKISVQNVGLLLVIATMIELFLLQFSASTIARIIASNIATIGGNLFAIFMIMIAMKSSTARPEYYRFWLLLVFAFIFNLAGEAIYNYLEIVSHETPFPSIADPFYLAFYPLILIAMFLFPTGKHSKERKYIVFLEMMVVLLSSLLIFTEFLFGPILNNNESLLEKVLSIFYPAGDFLVLWAIIYILFSKVRKSDIQTILFLAMGLFVFIIADTIYSFLNADNLYYTGHISDITYFIAYLFCALAAASYIENTQKDTSDEIAAENIHWMAYSPYIFLIAAIYSFYYVMRNDTFLNSEIIGISILAIITLIMLRQIIFFREYQQINLVLEESEKKYKLITENSTDLIYVYNLYPEPHFEYISPSCKSFTGYEIEEIYNEPNFYLKLVADEENIKYFTSVVKSQFLPSIIEERWRKKDGSIIWVEQLITINFDEKGNLISFQATVRDITDRKKAEEQIKESEEKFRSIAENSTDLIAITDNQGVITYVSPACRTIFGYLPQEMIGKKFTNFLDASSIPIALGEFRAALELLGRTKNLELQMKRKDGSLFYGELNGVAYQTASFLGTFVTIRDITERKEAEKLVQSSLAMFRSVFEATGTATMVVDEDGTILEANAQCLHDTGYNPEELVGTKWMNYVAKESLDIMLKYHSLRRIDPKMAPNKYDVKLINKKGDIRDVLLFANVIPNTKRSVVSMLDITERKRLEQSLRKSEQQYRLVIENVSELIFLARDGKIIMANPKVFDFLGYSMERVFNTPFIEYIHPDDRQMVLERHFKRLQGLIPEKETYEFRIVRNTGEIRYVEINTSLVEWDGKPTTIGFMRDVTERKRIEEELRENQRRLYTLMNNLPGMVYRCKNDRNWTMVFVSDGCEELCGYKPEELLNNNVISFNDLINPDDRDWIWEAWQDKLSRKEKMKLEYKITCKDGTTKWVWEQGQGVFNENGELEALEGFIADITERKRIEQQILMAKETYESIFNSVAEAIYIQDEDGRFIEVNLGAQLMYGYSRGELIGKTPADVSAPGKNNLEEVWRIFEQVKKDGVSRSFEFWGVRKNGEFFPKDVSLNKGKFFGKDCIIAIARDITERKQAEKLLQDTKNTYLSIYNSVSEAIYVIDENGNFVDVNVGAEKMYGYTREELIGKNFFEVSAPGMNDLELIQKIGFEVLTTGIPKHIEFWGIRKNGEIFPKDISINKGNYFGKDCSIVSAREITERKRAEQDLIRTNEELKKANSEKDKFFSIISHDLRSPFNSFLSITKILSEQFHKIKMSEFRQYASDLNSSAENLFKLLENLLSWSRLKRGVINFKPEELYLKEVVSACAYMLKAPIEQKEQELIIDVPEDIFVYADRPMLDTVLRNLLSNASKFTPRRGSIQVKAEADGDMAVVSVKDNGIGIPRDLIDKLFEIGVKTSRKGTEDEPSSGLGLILCKEFVEKNGGTLWLESTEGEGTTFYFTVPLIKI